MAKDKYLECALAVGTHGVRGVVKLENRCNSPAVLASLKRMYIKDVESYKEIKVLSSSPQKNMVLASFDGIATVDDAAAMKGTLLYAAREDFKLKQGEFFIADIIALPVIDAVSGEVHGKLKEVITPAGREIYVVEKPDGNTFMIPSVPEFIDHITLDGTETDGIYVRLIEGMKE